MKPKLLASVTSLATLAATSATAVPAATASPAPAGAPSARPNILLITVDDLRLNIGCFGDTAAITPNIDRLAARGTRFARAYIQQAVCNPSRQSMLTGLRPDTIRVWDLQAEFRKTSPGVVPLPEHFKINGYYTHSIGKIYHDGKRDPQSWSDAEQQLRAPKRDDYRLPENRDPEHKGSKAAATEFVDAADDDYVDGKTANDAVATLEKMAAREPGAQPFFLAVGFRKPHAPFTAPKRYWDLYEPAKIPPVPQPKPPRGAPMIALHDSVELRGYSDMPKKGEDFNRDQIARLRHAYYAATSFTDAQIGRVLDALDRTGLAENTIIVLWSDHGYHLGEHGLWCKTTCYESDTRVPLIVVASGERSRGVRSDALVELLDIYPTLVELCGLPPREGLEGRSLVPNINDANAPGKAGAFSQFPRPWLLRKNAAPDAMGYAVRTEKHRYIEWRKFGTLEVLARELYTYDGDQIFETENLAEKPENKELVCKLASMLTQKTP